MSLAKMCFRYVIAKTNTSQPFLLISFRGHAGDSLHTKLQAIPISDP